MLGTVSTEQDEPIHLIEEESTGDRFLVYSTAKGLQIDLRFEGDTLWMTQAQIAALFGRDVSAISRHIRNILDEGELDEASSLQKVQTTHGRPATIYNLDMVISVGYRVSSAQATLFRRWATGVLVQYARKGFVIDAPRLKEPGNLDRVRELREIIRDIRASEANLYAELRRICSMCQDYDGSDEASRQFFQHTQAKLVHAVVSMTPSELIHDRADHRLANMGLQDWPKDKIRKQDVTTSKIRPSRRC
ncbi:virulence RhuM family protein [Rhodobacter capsulatus]|uniref:Virulence protein RhuM family protein n=1 Tax=Rhodobacter capsulatus TaxID=1061 RepID=A0A0Q0V9P7_RHOCA|nr:RhuM family protein [Rhodobacter capsulatus]KQB13896.1 DNA-binding protein [Rhodobacter capsulatus]KQB13920.1 DNA-binding protein [Rhodobacter capsulatus]PZX21209.1 virulence RhuM family protein [Rhodobacter capsulatus]QNR62535.1 virulence RhuM family protein [Rhodobacter capsulatus]SDG25652.1 Virulence protein RhuM family protein [Rhodobacter capsulatus]